MAFSDITDVTTITGFSAEDEAVILAAMQTAYEGSAKARAMFDDWVAAGNTIEVDFLAGAFQASDGAFVPGSTVGKIEIDLAFLTNANYISNDGTAVEDSAVTGIVHEFVHALIGSLDDGDYVMDYKGGTVEFSNMIYSELGLPEQNSYVAYDTTGDILTRGFMYTGGMMIDRSVSQDRDWNSSAAGDSDDLLIGGPSDNILQSGDGDDFLFGGGGDDDLNGGDDSDTAVLTGKPVDYDVRLNPDGTWTSRHVRGTADEGTDTFRNIEMVRFEGGETFDLERDGLTFQTDFAFVVDQTGSMRDDIDAVKESATGIINALFDDDETDARIGVVGFRDNTIGQPTEVLLNFTDQDSFEDRKDAALDAIDDLSASGGGDIPETALDGLLTALNGSMGDWRAGAATKRVALFTDAPAKDGDLFLSVLGFATDIGATITSESSSALGSFGTVDTFELAPISATVGRDPISEGDVLPEFMPSDDPVSPLGGASKVQVFTIFIDTFTTADPIFEDIAEGTGGSVLTAAGPTELVTRILEVINATNYEITANSSQVNEGDDGTTTITYTISRDSDDTAATVELERGGTADDNDVSGVPISVDFEAGETVKTISVNVNGDTLFEENDTLELNIASVTDPTAIFSDTPAVTTIINDDAENVMPVAADDNAVTDEDTPVVIDVLTNDTDADIDDVLSVLSVGMSQNGFVSLNNDGTITYTPDPDYFGTDSFDYVVSDGRGGEDAGTVNITINEVSDTAADRAADIAADIFETVNERVPAIGVFNEFFSRPESPFAQILGNLFDPFDRSLPADPPVTMTPIFEEEVF